MLLPHDFLSDLSCQNRGKVGTKSALPTLESSVPLKHFSKKQTCSKDEAVAFNSLRYSLGLRKNLNSPLRSQNSMKGNIVTHLEL